MVRRLIGKIGEDARANIDAMRGFVRCHITTVQDFTPEEAREVARRLMLAAYDAERNVTERRK